MTKISSRGGATLTIQRGATPEQVLISTSTQELSYDIGELIRGILRECEPKEIVLNPPYNNIYHNLSTEKS